MTPDEIPTERLCLMGALGGDLIGSAYEHHSVKNYDFELFGPYSQPTDDSILTVAVADAILHDRDYKRFILEYARQYPHSGFGGFFRQWMYASDPQPYHSFGNGSAMRVSAVGWAFDSLEQVLEQAERSAAVTHDHPEGINGAQAAALCVYLARRRAPRDEIRREMVERFGYDLSRSLDEIRPDYHFDVTCQGTLPPAILAFLESENYEDAVRKAVSLGGDADTLGAIAGAMAEAFYGGVPPEIAREVRRCLPSPLWTAVEKFSRQVMKEN